MATEYSLKLKAALDTSEVQQELNKLRTQTQAPMSRNGQSAGNLQNVNSLGAQLNRTNLLLAQLNTTLSKLNFQQKTIQQTAGQQFQPGKSQFIPAIAYSYQKPVIQAPAPNRPQAKSASFAAPTLAPDINAIIRSKAARAALGDMWGSSYEVTALKEAMLVAETTPIANALAKAGVKVDPGAAAKRTISLFRGNSAAEMQQNIDAYLARQSILQNVGSQINPQLQLLQNNPKGPGVSTPTLLSKRGGRFLGAGLAALGREFMAGRADLYEARGDIESAKALRAGQSFIDKPAMYGMGGFMVGGLAGAAVGAGVGLAAATLETVFKELAESAKQLAADLKSAAAEVKAGKLVDKALADQQTELQLRKTLKSGNISRIEDTFKSLSTDKAALLAGMAEVDAEGGLEKFNRKTQTLVQLRGTKGTQFELSAEQYKLNEEEISRRKKVAEEYKEQADKLMKLNSTLEQFKDAIDTYKENLKKSLVEQGEADELAEIGAMANLQERIQLAKLGLSRYKDIEGDKNEMFYSSESGLQYRLDKAHKAALEARQRYEDQLDQASNMPDSQLMAAKLAEAEESRAEWQHQQHRADVLDEALRSLKLGELSEVLSKLVAPDMTSTNSLANSGYMINRSDDAARLEAMNNYEQTQVELQRQIKDILETKSFAATAG